MFHKGWALPHDETAHGDVLGELQRAQLRLEIVDFALENEGDFVTEAVEVGTRVPIRLKVDPSRLQAQVVCFVDTRGHLKRGLWRQYDLASLLLWCLSLVSMDLLLTSPLFCQETGESFARVSDFNLQLVNYRDFNLLGYVDVLVVLVEALGALVLVNTAHDKHDILVVLLVYQVRYLLED